jgi:hypothetical protein
MTNNRQARTFIAVSTWDAGYDDMPDTRSFNMYPDNGDTVTVLKGETEFNGMVTDWLHTMGAYPSVRSFKNDNTQSVSITNANDTRYVHIAINYIR